MALERAVELLTRLWLLTLPPVALGQSPLLLSRCSCGSCCACEPDDAVSLAAHPSGLIAGFSIYIAWTLSDAVRLTADIFVAPSQSSGGADANPRQSI